jgi:hypothetical protein
LGASRIAGGSQFSAQIGLIETQVVSPLYVRSAEPDDAGPGPRSRRATAIQSVRLDSVEVLA